MKKILLSMLFAAMLLVSSAAAVELFPVESVSADGQVSWGYKNENGEQVIPYQYASASAFQENGLASVTDSRGCMAIIDEQGNEVVPFRDAPASVEYSGGVIAFRYDDQTIYFDRKGALLGTFAGASGFFSEEGLLAAQDENGLWGYRSRSGGWALAPAYAQAGAFSSGYAVVQLAGGSGYAVIDSSGSQTPLPADSTPQYLEVYGGKLVILNNGSRCAFYSLETHAVADDYLYQEISPFHDGYAMVRRNNRWGVMNLDGVVTLPLTYNYLSYMGEGVYAARGEDGSVSALDANGSLIYRTDVYAGGFQSIQHGVCWHGTMDNGVIFFSKVGGYVIKLDNAENPTILTEGVASVSIGGKRQYVRLRDGKTLYSPERSYDMGYFKITTASYEKYLGMRNGQEYGWSLTYPVISGLADKTVQAKANRAIEAFFLEGSPLAARRDSLTGSYGVCVQGRLLVVWADCICGTGEGASVWNDNITLDLATGESYEVVNDLFNRDYLDVVQALLPDDIPYYLFAYPRITKTGVSFFLNTAQGSGSPASRAPQSQEYAFTFQQLDAALNKDGECWRALNGYAMDALNSYAGYADVAQSHWAYAAIREVTEAEYMQGSDGKFYPERPITAAEAAAVMVRVLDISTDSIAPPEGAPWYYIEATAASQAGLTAGLDEPVAYTAAMTRADAMQVLANALKKQGAAELSASEITAQLARFADGGSLPQNRRAAAALCVQSGAVVGSDGKLNGNDVFTRAQFAQILSHLIRK